MGRSLNFSEYAEWRGVSVEAVSKAVKCGRLKRAIVTDRRGRRLIDPDIADLEWTETRDPSRGGAPSDGDDERNATYHESRAKREAVNAALAELALAEKQGLLVSRDEVERSAFDIARVVRQSIMGIPDRIAGILASETDPSKVRLLLSDELRKALEELTSDVAE